MYFHLLKKLCNVSIKYGYEMFTIHKYLQKLRKKSIKMTQKLKVQNKKSL